MTSEIFFRKEFVILELIGNATRQFGGNMRRMGISEYVSSVAENYTKRFMESRYDKLAQTELFQSLKNRSGKERFFIEFAFYSLNAFLKHSTSEGTPLKAYLRGIATDFFPEMGKRLINGDTPQGREASVWLLMENRREKVFLTRSMKHLSRSRAGLKIMSTAKEKKEEDDHETVVIAV